MKGIGFAGLGKALADNTLSLLKGRKPRSADPKLQDQRILPNNLTDYDKLMSWQREKRVRYKQIRRIIYSAIVVILLTILTLYLTI